MSYIAMGLVMLTVFLRHETLRYRRVIRHFCRYANLDAEPELMPLYIAWLGYCQLFLALASGFLLIKHGNLVIVLAWVLWMMLFSHILAALVKRPSDQHIRDELELLVNNYLTTDLKIATLKVMWKKYVSEFR